MNTCRLTQKISKKAKKYNQMTVRWWYTNVYTQGYLPVMTPLAEFEMQLIIHPHWSLQL